MKALLLLTVFFLTTAFIPSKKVRHEVLDGMVFGKVHLYRQSDHPHQVAVFLSGDGGWNQGVIDMAEAVAEQDTLVIGLDTPAYLKKMRHSNAPCIYLGGDLENLSQSIQKKLGYADYQKPFVVGYSSGATLAYAAVVQSPPESFQGALSLGFCADLELKKPMCKGDGLQWRPLRKGKGYEFFPDKELKPHWIAFNGTEDKVCPLSEVRDFVQRVEHGELIALPKVGHGFGFQPHWMPQFVAAYDHLVSELQKQDAPKSLSATPATSPALDLQIRELPLHEVAPQGAVKNTLVVLFSGDGGWASFDKKLAHELAASGYQVIGFDSLRYFWRKKTVAESTAALLHTLEKYSQGSIKHIILAGYSFGADILPFMLNQLPPEWRERIDLLALAGPSRTAAFEIHVAGWFGKKTGEQMDTLKEIQQIKMTHMMCFHGQGDADSLCPAYSKWIESRSFPGGHRLDKHVKDISRDILSFAAKQAYL